MASNLLHKSCAPNDFSPQCKTMIPLHIIPYALHLITPSTACSRSILRTGKDDPPSGIMSFHTPEETCIMIELFQQWNNRIFSSICGLHLPLPPYSVQISSLTPPHSASTTNPVSGSSTIMLLTHLLIAVFAALAIAAPGPRPPSLNPQCPCYIDVSQREKFVQLAIMATRAGD